jgi:hypothetical protein
MLGSNRARPPVQRGSLPPLRSVQLRPLRARLRAAFDPSAYWPRFLRPHQDEQGAWPETENNGANYE